MALVNTMEVIVSNKVDDFFKTADCCKCDQCKEDIMCIALNKLPPKYVSTDKGQLFSRLDSIMIKQHSVDIDVAVLAAIDFVKAHPKHSKQTP